MYIYKGLFPPSYMTNGIQQSPSSSSSQPTQVNGHWFIGTVKEELWSPTQGLPAGILYLKGQLERGASTGFVHWQLVAYCEKRQRVSGLSRFFGGGHWELTRSAASRDYVWKDDTYVSTRFELGSLPIRRNNKVDWDAIRVAAIAGLLDDPVIPASIYVQNYSSLCRIAKDHASPSFRPKHVELHWGVTGSGKSHFAWDKLGASAYAKNPRTKWWDAYKGQDSIIVDEFRGVIDISYILQWTDRYPLMLEVKGGAVPCNFTTLIFTSNLPIEQWYPDLDSATLQALKRRFHVIKHYSTSYRAIEEHERLLAE